MGVIDIVAISSSIGRKNDNRFQTLAEQYIIGDTWPFHLETKLAEAVISLLTQIGKKLDIVAINTGPGSYTSLRSGLAFLKGWYLSERARTGKEPFVIVGICGLVAMQAQALGQKVLQEERNSSGIGGQKRYWQLNESTKHPELIEKSATVPTESKLEPENVVIRTLPKQGSYVNIGKEEHRMGALVAREGIKSYTKRAQSNITTLMPIYE